MASEPSTGSSGSFDSSPFGSSRLGEGYSLPIAVSRTSSAPVYPLDGEKFLAFPGKAAAAGAVDGDNGNAALLLCQQVTERNVFLCYKDPQSWPSRVEASEFDRLPRYLTFSMKCCSRKMPVKTRLTICEGRDGTDSSNGDVLLFPDMVRYRGLTHFDVDTFVEEVLVNNKEWPSGKPEKLSGMHVFVCSHGSRDARCGALGPVLIKQFKDEVTSRGLERHVFIRACSHIGGHKYAGNVIIYGPDNTGTVTGHCYGFVQPHNIPALFEEHLHKAAIFDLLSRSQTETEQGGDSRQAKESSNDTKKVEEEKCACCQIHDQSKSLLNRHGICSASNCLEKARVNHNYRKRAACTGRFNTWYQGLLNTVETWEGEDTWAVLALVGAITSVSVACHLYRKLS